MYQVIQKAINNHTKNLTIMRFLVKFENGNEVIANDDSYITLITFYEMFNSPIKSVTPL